MIRLKTLLFETKFDRLVTLISRYIINQIKKKKTSFNFVEKINDNDVVFFIKIKKEKSLTNNSDVVVDGSVIEDEIEIIIYIKPGADFKDYANNLIEELKDTLTHEIHHIIKQFKGQKIAKSDYEYLTASGEVEAFVVGLYKKSKMRKLPVDKVIDDALILYLKAGDINKNQYKKVKKIWIDYAKKRFPKAKFSEK